MRDSSDTPQFSRYTIEGTLGSGGMGTVYLAYHEILNRPVALKVPKRELASSDHFVERFLREAKALGTLHHRNIVTVYDAGIENDTPYIAMKYIAGETLSDIIRTTGKVEIDQAIRWGRQIADALAYLHDQQILHRDLKGANVIIDRSGDAIVADFGIAQIEPDSTLTRGVLGTPSYMSPEQAMGKDLDARSDMHGLGVLLYQCLTGELPFQDDNSYALIQKVIHAIPSPVSDARPETPVWLENIVHTCLKKHPGQRFKDDRALMAAFDDALTRPVQASKSLTFLPARRRLSLTEPASPPRQSSVRVLDLIQSKSRPIKARLDSEHTITIFEPGGLKTPLVKRVVQHGIFLTCAALVALILVAPLTLSYLTGASPSDANGSKPDSSPTAVSTSSQISTAGTEPLPSHSQTAPPGVKRLRNRPANANPVVDSLSVTQPQPFPVVPSPDIEVLTSMPVPEEEEHILVMKAPASAPDSSTESLRAPSVIAPEEPAIPEVIANLIRISTRRELVRSLELFRKAEQIRYGNRKRVNEPDLAYVFLMNNSNEGLHSILIPSPEGWIDAYTGREMFEEKGEFYMILGENNDKTTVENVDPIWVELITDGSVSATEEEPEAAQLKRRVTGW